FEQVPDGFKPILDIPAYTPDNSMMGQPGQQQSHQLADLGYEGGEVINTDTSITYTQPGWDGMQYQVAVRWKTEGSTCTGTWSITSRYPNRPVDKIVSHSNKKAATTIAAEALGRGYPPDQRSHR